MEAAATAIHLIPGKTGHFLVILAFVGALTASVAYFMASRARERQLEQSWRRFARIAFGIHGAAVLGVVLLLFYIISQHYFEYYYVWRHSSTALEFRYLFACFWEGQEGSFLLWSFWHVVLGSVLVFTAKRWEAPVMSTVTLVQAFLGSMLLGVYILGYKVGSSPFILLRDAMPNAPVLQMNPGFVPQDGNGLNPLLQNYWMVIHPPTLFLGFSSTLIPFAYAIAALWKREYTRWVKPVLPWTLFSVMILGTGILMGGAWAYEALSFGGFWAWDPVENASLVPWLALVGGLHTLVAYRHSGHSLRISFALVLLTFFLILYSTFLTRSGILGDTSVHAFTDLGMSGQLLLFLLAFVLMALVLLLYRWKKIPSPKKEEASYSREFWMFVGALVFVISATHITIVTSFPVFNKLLGTNWAPPAEPIEHYNRVQLPVAIIIALLSAVGQFFKYKQTDPGRFFKRVSIPLLIALVLAGTWTYFLEMYNWQYALLLICSIYTIIANGDYLLTVLSGKIRVGGGAVAHIGVGLMLVGILISNSKQEAISINTLGLDYGEGFDAQSNRENILLYKGKPMTMGNYRVTYHGDSAVPPNVYYKVQYEKLHPATGVVEESFVLYPNVQFNPEMGDVANPDTRHYLFRDIYTHVTAVSQNDEANEEPEFRTYVIGKGDTIFTSTSYVVLKGLNLAPRNRQFQPQDGDIAVGAMLQVHNLEATYEAEPIYVIRGNREEVIVDQVEELGLVFRFTKVYPNENRFEIAVAETEPQRDYIIMKAIVFPFINLLWLGALVMIAGLVLSMLKRIREYKKELS